MKLCNLISAFAQAYVDAHEEEICEAILEALDVDLEEVAEGVAECIGDPTEAVKEEILARM